MDLINILLYIMILLIGSFAVISSSGFIKSYIFPSLSNYFHFIISFNIVGLIFFILNRFFGGDLCKSILIMFPLFIITLYFFISFILSFVKKKYSSSIKVSFFSISVILFIGFALLYNNTLKNMAEKKLMNLYLNFLILLIIIIILFLLIYVFTRGIKELDKKRIKAVKNITLTYCILLLILFTSFLFELDPQMSTIIIVLFFLINVYPILYLKNFLNMNYIDHLLINEKSIDFENFFKKHKISDREKEILKLLVQGKSNKDIEDILFISLKTVKNHIYNIYKKASVKSRIQLVNIVTKYKK